MLETRTAALPASLRRMNQRKAISLLLRSRELSRADLAKAAGMSQPTAGKIISALIDQHILREASGASPAEGKARLGRPGRMLRLEDRAPRFLGVELGVKHSLVAGLTLGASLDWSKQFPTPAGPDAWLAGLRAAVGGRRIEKLDGVVVSVPGIVDELAGHVHYCPNLHWLENFGLVAETERVTGLPVILVQEIRALGLGHVVVNGPQDLFLIDFGVGVGGAVIFDGKLQQQGAPLSGEIGHTPVPGNNRPCGCGGVGCLETLVSEAGLLASFKESGQAKNPTWKDLLVRIEHRGVEPWLASSLQAAGRVIAGALNVLGLSRVVVTGYPAGLPDAFTECLRRQIAQDALWGRFGEVTCEVSERKRFEGMIASGLDRILFPQMEGAPMTGVATKKQIRYKRKSS